MIVGCGYVGQRVARMWRQMGHCVTILTRSAENARRFESEGFEPVVGDVTRPETLERLPAVETLLYSIGLDRASIQSQHEVYVRGLQNVLARLPAVPRQFLYLSSTSVYGQHQGEWVDEESPCEPRTANGAVCLEAEVVLRKALPAAIILRLAGIYGPGRLAARIDELLRGAPLDGHPDAWVNLVHVDDIVASILACEVRAPEGGTLLVADNRPTRRLEYYRLLAGLIGAPEVLFNRPEEQGERPPELGKRCSNRRLREDLGVRLAYPTIETGLPAAISAKAAE